MDKTNTKIQMPVSEGYLKELKRSEERKETISCYFQECIPDQGKIVFEAGCGHGHWLTSYAMENPKHICLGIDLIAGRVDKANKKKEKRDLKHLHFIKAELGEFLEVLPKGITFEAVVFLFPDPWPKARHHKKRMIQSTLLEQLASRMEKHGRFYFRTDDRPYFDWTVEHLNESPFWTIKEKADWLHEETTYFQNLMDGYFSVVAEVQ
jgi:tRNA (guanine-N7-)-methyltransferase